MNFPPDSLYRNKALNLQPMQLSLTSKATQSVEDAPVPSAPQPNQNIAPLLPSDDSTSSPKHPLSNSHDQSKLPMSSDAIQQLEACVAKREAPSVSQTNGHLHLFKKRKTSSGAQATPPPMPTSRPSTESKPLKPLVAFMGQFLENLLSVSTQCIDPGALQSSNKVAGRPSSRRKSSARTRISGAMRFLGFFLLSWACASFNPCLTFFGC